MKLQRLLLAAVAALISLSAAAVPVGMSAV